ncbi:MAG: gamma-glutamyltransferase family protein [Legionella sp.]|nr:gamma-glutamyltransferase family protein [Legionella sp.]
MKYIKIIPSIVLMFLCIELHAISPESASGWLVKPLIYGEHAMVVTNNPYASETALSILKKGGNAVDAAIAAAFVLGLTEPQSSGIGGGGYALSYHHASQGLTVYNGREQAPHSTKPQLFLNNNKQPLPLVKAMLSPKSIGVPGEVALLYTLHKEEGRMPWKQLVMPAIHLAKNGFSMSPRLYGMLKEEKDILIKNPDIQAVYFDKDEVRPIGSPIKNSKYAQSLRKIAADPQSFYTGKLASDIIDTINQRAGKPLFSMEDFSRYKVRIEKPLCAPFRSYTLCTTGGESGGLTLLELLGVYEQNYEGKSSKKTEWIYHFLEASKLAYADRNLYNADPTFTAEVHEHILTPQYIKKRAIQVNTLALKTPVKAGLLKNFKISKGSDESVKAPGTTSLTIVDSEGNAISTTITIEQKFGSHLFVDGFFLNNQLTDFSFKAVDAQGNLIANRPQAYKRPRSAISPTLVFDKKHQLIALTGSPGGGNIICYVAKSLIFMLDFNKNPKESAAAGNLCSDNVQTIIEKNSSLSPAISALKQKGESIKSVEMVSGTTNIKAGPKKGWYGAADPRRAGVALGN